MKPTQNIPQFFVGDIRKFYSASGYENKQKGSSFIIRIIQDIIKEYCLSWKKLKKMEKVNIFLYLKIKVFVSLLFCCSNF